MKPLALVPLDPNRFLVLQVAMLRKSWISSSPKDLHQCKREGRSCGLNRQPFHESSCPYVAVSWVEADGIARQIHRTPPLDPQGLLNTAAVQAQAVDLAGNPGLGQAATSLLTDPVEIGPRGDVINGRHRVAAFADQGLKAAIGIDPVTR